MPASSDHREVAVVICDPHPLYREGLAQAIARCPNLELVSEASDATSAVEQIAHLAPEVVVVELKLLAEDERLLERIAEEAPDARVLLLCGRDDPDDIYRAIEAGAVGCLFKEQGAEEITEAIATLARGEAVLAPKAAELVARQIRLRRDRDRVTLTDREREVLTLTAEGLSSEKVAGELAVSQSTIKHNLSNIYAKLQVTCAAAAVSEAIRLDLLG
jgi:DNA-binding NarL/FixJ family response regulator